jgi:DNA-binding CsgD family transcriptional regulator
VSVVALDSGPTTVGRGRHVAVVDRGGALAHAVIALLTADGWTVVERAVDPSALWVVTAATAAVGLCANRTLLIVPPNPVASARGIADTVEGRVGVCIGEDELDRLSTTLDSHDVEEARLSHRLMSRARRMPVLDARKRAVLELYLDRLTTEEIGQLEGMSRTTVKRITDQLYTTFGVRRRGEFVTAALEMGFEPAKRARR